MHREICRYLVERSPNGFVALRGLEGASVAALRHLAHRWQCFTFLERGLPSTPMSRAPRLLALIEELRRHRRPVRGALLAEALGISLRTLYRDIATLSAQGAPIAGEAGIGYILRP